jgi:hypothetical protein
MLKSVVRCHNECVMSTKLSASKFHMQTNVSHATLFIVYFCNVVACVQGSLTRWNDRWARRRKAKLEWRKHLQNTFKDAEERAQGKLERQAEIAGVCSRRRKIPRAMHLYSWWFMVGEGGEEKVGLQHCM